MKAICFTGYPKSGNTWIATAIKNCDVSSTELGSDYDIYQIAKKKKKLLPHSLLSDANNESIGFYKTHSLPSKYGKVEHSAKKAGVTSILKVLHIKRNPLDVLLSYTNFSRYKLLRSSVPISGSNNPEVADFISRMLNNGLTLEDLSSKGTLEYLRDNGLLSILLKNFTDYGTSICDYSIVGMSGSWLSHTLSWQHNSDMAYLGITYESLLHDFDIELEKLAEFLSLEKDALRLGFDRQLDSVSKLRSEKNDSKALFYNKMKAGYYQDYFTRQDLVYFFDRTWRLLDLCGYGWLADA